MKTACFLPAPEPLEIRIAPASLNLSGTLLGYSAAAGVTNGLTISLAGGIYTFTDTGETITLNAAAITAGFTGSGTNTVTGPASAFENLRIDLSNGNDTLNVNGLANGLSVLESSGTDTVNLNTGASAVGDDVTVEADIVNLTSLEGVNRLTLTTDTLAVNGTPSFSATLTIQTLTADRPINLGTETAGSLSLSTTELDRLIHSGLTRIGSATSGSITISTAIAGLAGTLSLRTGGGVTDTAAGSITVGALAIEADAAVVLDGANNDVAQLAVSVADAGVGFTFTEQSGYEIAVVDGLTGLTTNTAAGGNVTLNAANVTQAAGARIVANALVLLGTGSFGTFTLTDPANNVSLLAANTGGAINYTDADELNVGSSGGTSGITTSNDTVTLTTLAGDLRVTNGNGTTAPDIATGTGRIRLEAGVAGSDFAIILNTNAGLSGQLSAGINSIQLTADRMTLGAPINGGAGRVVIRPFEDATTVDLGGADAAGVLGLTDTELDQITAGEIFASISTFTPVVVSGAISPANTTALNIVGSTVSGAGGIVVARLDLSSTSGIDLPGASDVDFLRLSATGAPVTFADADGFTFGPSTGSDSVGFGGEVLATFAAGSGTVTIANRTLNLSITDVTPGVGHDQFVVQGALTLGAGARLNVNDGPAVPAGTEFVILANDGADAVTGVFSDSNNIPLLEGAFVPNFSPLAIITYTGGDGNDVAIVTLPALDVALSADKKTATFRDVDGDLVIVKTTRGVFDGSEFDGIQLSPTTGQLFGLELDADFTGANITITAKPSAQGGDGFINFGRFDASNVDLGHVRIGGDVSRLEAGTLAGEASGFALKSLTVQSIGLFGDSTTRPGVGATGVNVSGAIGKVTIAGDLRNNFAATGAGGRIGPVVIGGSVTPAPGSSGVSIVGDLGIASLKIGGDIRNNANGTVSISTEDAIGAITVGGSILGLANTSSVQIRAVGQPVAPSKGVDLALKSLTVKGSVEFLSLSAGPGASETNADGSIGSINVGGDWMASSVTAGAFVFGGDGVVGTNDDQVNSNTTRDNPALFATIGSFTVKGQALGTHAATDDMFAVLTERIGKAKVGPRAFAFTTGAAPEAFFAAPTFDGAGAENPAFDFILREFGATTPTPAFGGTNLDVSSDGKTATFTDVDGDKVTVKRSAGAFAPGDFAIVDNAAGGGQLQAIAPTAAPGNARFDLIVTAQPGPAGGNGFVNIGRIDATGLLLGTVKVAGDLGQVTAGVNGSGQPGLTALTMHSFRALGSSTGSAGNASTLTGGAGSLTVQSDARDGGISLSGTGAKLGTLTIRGAFANVSFSAEDGIGSVKIGGSMRGGRISVDGPIGTISIGGDLVDNDATTIQAGGQLTVPAKGLDFAIKSLTVKGSVENASIVAGGLTNADAAIGTISVGRAWIASTAIAGTDDGTDNLFGTADDTKVSGGTVRDEVGRFSTIASVIIKGQALGTGATGDHFGIVAEQIGKAQIGKAKLRLNPGERDAADAFLLAPLGLGDGSGAGDFFLREIVV